VGAQRVVIIYYFLVKRVVLWMWREFVLFN